MRSRFKPQPAEFPGISGQFSLFQHKKNLPRSFQHVKFPTIRGSQVKGGLADSAPPVSSARWAGPPGRLEQAILDAEQITCDDFRAIRGMKVHGARRPLRFRADDLQLSTGGDNHGAFVELSFTLAAGCYATMILREICKDTLQEGLAEEADDADTETGDDD